MEARFAPILSSGKVNHASQGKGKNQLWKGEPRDIARIHGAPVYTLSIFTSSYDRARGRPRAESSVRNDQGSGPNSASTFVSLLRVTLVLIIVLKRFHASLVAIPSFFRSLIVPPARFASVGRCGRVNRAPRLGFLFGGPALSVVENRLPEPRRPEDSVQIVPLVRPWICGDALRSEALALHLDDLKRFDGVRRAFTIHLADICKIGKISVSFSAE